MLVLRSVHLVSSRQSIYETLRCLEANLIRRILELTSLMSHSSDRPQLAKFKKYFEVNTSRTPHEFSNELYANLSNNPDTKETILAYALLRSKYFDYVKPSKGSFGDLKSCFRNIPESKLLSPYNSISHQITRLLELDLHTQINNHLVKQFLSEKLQNILSVGKTRSTILMVSNNETEWKNGNRKKHPFFDFKHIALARKEVNTVTKMTVLKSLKIFGCNCDWENRYYFSSKLYDSKMGKIVNKQEFVTSEDRRLIIVIRFFSDNLETENWFSEYVDIVLNSIFNLTQMKRIVSTFGSNYILSHSYLANIHKKAGTWLKHLQLCQFIDHASGNKFTVEERMKDLIGLQDYIVLDALTEYQMALQYFYQANQMHREGLVYRNRVSNLIYLEDDFNDNLYHFGAALERLKINSGVINDSIENLKENLHKANMYKYTTFAGDESPFG